MLRQLNTITKTVLVCLTFQELGNNGWHPKKQREAGRETIHNFLSIALCNSRHRAPIYTRKHVLSKDFRKSLTLRPCCNHVEKLWFLKYLVPIRSYVILIPYMSISLSILSCDFYKPLCRRLHWKFIYNIVYHIIISF